MRWSRAFVSQPWVHCCVCSSLPPCLRYNGLLFLHQHFSFSLENTAHNTLLSRLPHIFLEEVHWMPGKASSSVEHILNRRGPKKSISLCFLYTVWEERERTCGSLTVKKKRKESGCGFCWLNWQLPDLSGVHRWKTGLNCTFPCLVGLCPREVKTEIPLLLKTKKENHIESGFDTKMQHVNPKPKPGRVSVCTQWLPRWHSTDTCWAAESNTARLHSKNTAAPFMLRCWRAQILHPLLGIYSIATRSSPSVILYIIWGTHTPFCMVLLQSTVKVESFRGGKLHACQTVWLRASVAAAIVRLGFS